MKSIDISTELRTILDLQEELIRVLEDDLEGTVLYSDIVSGIEEIATDALPCVTTEELLAELESPVKGETARNWVLLAHCDSTDVVQPMGSYDSFLVACEVGFELLDDQQITGFCLRPDKF